MGKIIFVNYASGKFLKNKKWNNKFIRIFIRPDIFVDSCDEDLKRDPIYLRNKKIFDSEIGGGYWAWKPWVILRAFEEAEEGDTVIYQDCGAGFRFKNIIYPKEIIRLSREKGCISGVQIPERGPNKFWTKKECFSLMGCSDEKYKASPQIEATISVWQVNQHNKNFLNRWLNYCLELNIVSDPKPEESQIEGFCLHRHDQSVLTNLIYENDLYFIKQNIGIYNIFKSLSFLELYISRNRFPKNIIYKIILSLVIAKRKLNN